MHHVSTLTANLDRLIAFYQRVLDAPVVLDMEEEGLRHAFISLGPTTLLHPFEIPGTDVPQGELPMFERGRIDHIALSATDEAAFWEVRRRVIAEGAGTGEVHRLRPPLRPQPARSRWPLARSGLEQRAPPSTRCPRGPTGAPSNPELRRET